MQGENINKNRYSTVLPTESSRVLLLPIDDNESSTYINAVYVDSYKQKNAFILTQSPLPRTVFDFWRMVSEHGTTSIVMLNAVDEGDVCRIIFARARPCVSAYVFCLPARVCLDVRMCVCVLTRPSKV